MTHVLVESVRVVGVSLSDKLSTKHGSNGLSELVNTLQRVVVVSIVRVLCNESEADVVGCVSHALSMVENDAEVKR